MHPPQVSEWCSPSSRRCRQNSSQNCQSSGKKELGIYIVLYCVLLYTQNVLQKVMEEYLFLTTTSVQHRPGWCDGSHSTMAPVPSQQTSYMWRGERSSQLRGWWLLARREFGQDTGVTPLLFMRSAMGFLMTTERQDLGSTSHPKDGAFFTVLFYSDGACPHHYLGALGSTQTTGWAPPAGINNTYSNSYLVFSGGLPYRY